MVICSTGYLAHQIMERLQEFEQIKNELNLIKIDKMSLEKEADTAQLKEEDLKNKIAELERKLEEFQKDNPEVIIEPEDENAKYAYLTFDDGPSQNTIKILDFLKVNGIKATFFVVGYPQHENIYKRIFDEGHTLALHTYTHKFNEIYKDVDSFMADIHKLSNLVEGITGEKSKILRFAGGSNNTVSRKYNKGDIMPEIIKRVKEEGFVYYDWNVDSRDAEKARQDVNVIIDSVLEGSKDKSQAIILMHDTSVKDTTVEALPHIIEGLKKQGFLFKEITQEVQPVQFR